MKIEFSESDADSKRVSPSFAYQLNGRASLCSECCSENEKCDADAEKAVAENVSSMAEILVNLPNCDSLVEQVQGPIIDLLACVHTLNDHSISFSTTRLELTGSAATKIDGTESDSLGKSTAFSIERASWAKDHLFLWSWDEEAESN